MWLIAMATERLRVSESHDRDLFPLNYDHGSFTLMMLADMNPVQVRGALINQSINQLNQTVACGVEPHS